MRLKLLYKSYSGAGVFLLQGQEHDFSEADGHRLLEAFPGWFEEVSVRRSQPTALEPPSSEETSETAEPGPGEEEEAPQHRRGGGKRRG